MFEKKNPSLSSKIPYCHAPHDLAMKCLSGTLKTFERGDMNHIAEGSYEYVDPEKFMHGGMEGLKPLLKNRFPTDGELIHPFFDKKMLKKFSKDLFVSSMRDYFSEKEEGNKRVKYAGRDEKVNYYIQLAKTDPTDFHKEVNFDHILDELQLKKEDLFFGTDRFRDIEKPKLCLILLNRLKFYESVTGNELMAEPLLFYIFISLLEITLPEFEEFLKLVTTF